MRPSSSARTVIGGAMGVGAGDHGDAVAADAVVAGEDIGGQVGSAELPVVDRAVGIGPGHADEDVVSHGVTPL